MLTAEEARLQGKSKFKEWVANDLEYLNDMVLDAVKEKDETFVAVDLKFLHKDCLPELVKQVSALGYKTHLSEKTLLLQWSKPATDVEPKITMIETTIEDDDFSDFDEENEGSYDDDLK